MSAHNLPDHTPIIVGAGQCVQPLHLPGSEATANQFLGPMDLAADACQAALNDAGNISAGNVDTIAMVKLFSDSAPFLQSPFGYSRNPPQSIAKRIGAAPSQGIYSDVGGTLPQQFVVEMLLDLAQGKKEVVLICGSEARGNQKSAVQEGVQLDWNEEFPAELDCEDRGYGKIFPSEPEMANGIFLPMYFYSLIENARAHSAGQDKSTQRKAMGTLFEHFTQVAAENPYSQFPVAHTSDELATVSNDNFLLTDPYPKRFISQDGVNQGAAILLTTVGKARELGIPEHNWIHLHGYAQGQDNFTYLRPDVGTSDVMGKVFERTFEMAGVKVSDIDLFDIYSCFPCAVSSACDFLTLPQDGSTTLTLTGGLPYFGGPGNNYSMHGLAEMVTQLRDKPSSYGLVTANGGVLTKHAAGVYSAQASKIDWLTAQNPSFPQTEFNSKPAAEAPEDGTVISYMLSIKRTQLQQCSIIAETAEGERFVANSTDPELLASVEKDNPIGKPIQVLQRGQEGNEKSNIFGFK